MSERCWSTDSTRRATLLCATLRRRRPPPARTAPRFFWLVVAIAIAANGLWLFAAGLFFENETNVWLVIGGGWLIGLGGDRLWSDFLGPYLGYEQG